MFVLRLIVMCSVFLILCIKCAQSDETAVNTQYDRLTFDTHEIK